MPAAGDSGASTPTSWSMTSAALTALSTSRLSVSRSWRRGEELSSVVSVGALMVACLQKRGHGQGGKHRSQGNVCLFWLPCVPPPLSLSFFLSFQLCSQAGYELKIPASGLPSAVITGVGHIPYF